MIVCASITLLRSYLGAYRCILLAPDASSVSHWQRERERKRTVPTLGSRRALGRTYTRGLGFVRRIKKTDILVLRFPYLRDHKPSSSPPAANRRQVQQRAPLRFQGGEDAVPVGRITDLTKGNERRNATYGRAGINKFRSKLRSRDQARQMLEINGILRR